jgi:RNA polymerase sigma-70 factor (ECF subfamily)
MKLALNIPGGRRKAAADGIGERRVNTSAGDGISDLIGRVSLGDRAAFSALYDRTSAKLFGVSLRILRERSQAQDALQETYVKVWRNASLFSGMGQSPMSWLIAIARNQAIDMLRARGRPAADLDEAATVEDAAPDPEQAALAGDEARRLALCLGELPAERAGALRAAYMEGYSYEELASRYKVPLNTMRTWLRRGLIGLRECLERGGVR